MGRSSLGPAGDAAGAASMRSQSMRDGQVAGAILLLASVLRIVGIGHEPLWVDEGYSWWDAQQSFADLWRLVPQCDPHPPLYAFLLKIWTWFAGDSSGAMRSLSALIGVVTTGVVMLAGREISRRVAWIAGVLFAVAPFEIEFAFEARPYTLVAFGAALLAFGALRVLRTLRDPVAARTGWIALVAGATVMLWSNNTSILFMLALAIIIAGILVADRDSRVLIRPLLVAAAVIALLWLPYLPVYLEQARGVSADFWIQKPDLWRIGNELRFVVGLGSFSVLWFVLAIWAAGLALLWRRGLWREALLLAGLFALPVALNFAVSVLVKPIFLARALIGIAPVFAIVLAAALAALDARWLRITTLGAFAAARIFAVAGIYTEENRKEPWNDIAQMVAADARGNALVLVVPNELELPLAHALTDTGRTLDIRGVPAEFPAPGLAARYPSGKCAPSVVGMDLAPLAQAVHSRSAVVLVTRRNNTYDPNQRIRGMLKDEGMLEIRSRDFGYSALLVRTFVWPRQTAIVSH